MLNSNEIYKKTYEEWKKTQPKIPRYINNPDWEFDAIEEQLKKWQEYKTRNIHE